ncbi:MAG: LytTR family transcriptional regulator [Bacteroidales bacterium]|nr:LytTR family transcriptional regulator [Bacteroidales bacterium]
MHFLLRKIPDYLFDKQNVLRQIAFTALFALVFINIYAPFNAEGWFRAGKAELFLYSSLYILAGMLVIVVSRLIFIQLAMTIRVRFLVYILWNLMEILLLALAYTAMDVFILENDSNPFGLFLQLLFVTIFVLAIPYSISWLYYSWQDQKRKLDELTSATSLEYRDKKMVNFYDETGKLRFTLNSADVLYIESTDNYVTVHVQEEQRVKKIMLRNTMKRLEKELENTLISRCHRSFMVNFENVRMVRLSGTNLFIYMNNSEQDRIPVSRTYTEKIHEMVNMLSD